MTFAEAPRDVVGEECGRPLPYAAGRLLPSFLPSFKKVERVVRQLFECFVSVNLSCCDLHSN